VGRGVVLDVHYLLIIDNELFMKYDNADCISDCLFWADFRKLWQEGWVSFSTKGGLVQNLFLRMPPISLTLPSLFFGVSASSQIYPCHCKGKFTGMEIPETVSAFPKFRI
jgi:hypothetical protein